jgi:hypothetical protein
MAQLSHSSRAGRAHAFPRSRVRVASSHNVVASVEGAGHCGGCSHSGSSGLRCRSKYGPGTDASQHIVERACRAGPATTDINARYGCLAAGRRSTDLASRCGRRADTRGSPSRPSHDTLRFSSQEARRHGPSIGLQVGHRARGAPPAQERPDRTSVGKAACGPTPGAAPERATGKQASRKAWALAPAAKPTARIRAPALSSARVFLSDRGPPPRLANGGRTR